VAQLVAALITVHGLLSFLSDVYSLLDPSGKTLWLSVDHRSLGPVNDMVLLSRWIKEAVHTQKEGQQAMNRDEGSYQLSHAYDRLFDMASSRRVKNRKNWVPASSDEGLW